MQKIIRIDDLVIVTLDDGQTYQKNDITDEEFNKIVNAESEDDIIEIFCPTIAEIKEEIRTLEELEDRVRKSNLLEWKNDAVYFPIVSELSVPKELVVAILDAEDNNDSLKLETYKNFWTLMSLNPDEQCRKNLYWFLERNGLVISKHGFFVAYRNVDKTSTEGVYTDHHSHSFRIKIGEMVTMPRQDCDARQDVTCSCGLHLGARTWLKHNYYGNVGLVCLCNPADVTAVPHLDYYGKLRTCAYLPIDFCHFDSAGDVIPYDKNDGFDCEYVPKVIYEGIIGTEKDTAYKFEIPEVPGITRDRITDNLLEIAKTCIVDRNILYDSQQEG
jgi:hypothetical protein